MSSTGASNEEDAVAVDSSADEAPAVLQGGKVIGGQRITWSSNDTFYVHIDAGAGRYVRAVYKPRDGERPLQDFPDGSLYKREYASYLLSKALGWPDVPLTLIREGPYGIGSMQIYVDSDPQVTYFELLEGNRDEFLRLATFDVLTNNADRKAGHCLLGHDGRIWSIDHGLTFHSIFKMRTVMLEFWGKEIPQPLLDDIETLHGRLESNSGPASELTRLMSAREIDALNSRIEVLLREPAIPVLDPRRNVPWPLV